MASINMNVEIAVGMLMASHHISPDEARRLLYRLSAERRIEVVEYARWMIDSHAQRIGPAVQHGTEGPA
jgi:AmiR/NasT family two-component response regulator